MIYSSLIFPGLIGFIGMVAITLSRVIDKPAPRRNFLFSFLMIVFAFGYIAEMTKSDSMQFWVFKLGSIALIILASLIGAYTGFVLAVLYKGYRRPAFLSGVTTGVTAFFMSYFFPSSELGYQEFHDIPSLLRGAVIFIVGAGSYILFCVLTDAKNNAD